MVTRIIRNDMKLSSRNQSCMLLLINGKSIKNNHGQEHQGDAEDQKRRFHSEKLTKEAGKEWKK